MTQDLVELICTKNTSSIASKKMSFSSLPPEITREIFCNIDSKCLFGLKHVCKYWYEMITELLDVQDCQVKQEVIDDAVNIFKSWVNGRRKFSIYEAPHSLRKIINKQVLSKQGRGRVYELNAVGYMRILEKLESHATYGGAYSRGCQDVVGSVWRTVLAITGLEYSVEELREKSFDDTFVESFMTKYTWYIYMSTGMADIAWDAGIIALYPDNKKFSNLFAYDFD